MNTTELLNVLDERIKNSKKIIALGQSWERLSNNRDFKEIFFKGYFQEEAVRLVSIKGDPEVQSPERQAAIIRQMDAIGCVQSYLRKIERDVQQAIKDLEDAEADRVEVLTGGVE